MFNALLFNNAESMSQVIQYFITLRLVIKKDFNEIIERFNNVLINLNAYPIFILLSFQIMYFRIILGHFQNEIIHTV